VIVRDDFDLRGRKPGEVAKIIRDGLISGGLSAAQIVERPVEEEAIAYAVSEAQPGDLIVYIADKPEIAARYVESLRQSVKQEQQLTSAGR